VGLIAWAIVHRCELIVDKHQAPFAVPRWPSNLNGWKLLEFIVVKTMRSSPGSNLTSALR